jgi:hypothetical protein
MKKEIIRENVFCDTNINTDFEKEHVGPGLLVMLTLPLLLGHKYLLLLLIIIASKTFESGIGVKGFFFFPKNFLVSCRSKIRIIKQICSAYRFLLFFRFLLLLACWTTFDKEGASLVFINQALRITTGLQGMQPPC